MKSRSKSGFTLVEILIVVVILGILAAIVIPQFSQASTEARGSNVKSNLQMIRSQIELYKIQHGDVLPTIADGGDELIRVLTTKTNYDGVLYTGAMATAGDASYGPYMQKWPVNAANAESRVLVQAADPAADAVNADNGWVFNNVDDNFFAIDETNTEMSSW